MVAPALMLVKGFWRGFRRFPAPPWRLGRPAQRGLFSQQGQHHSVHVRHQLGGLPREGEGVKAASGVHVLEDGELRVA